MAFGVMPLAERIVGGVTGQSDEQIRGHRDRIRRAKMAAAAAKQPQRTAQLSTSPGALAERVVGAVTGTTPEQIAGHRRNISQQRERIANMDPEQISGARLRNRQQGVQALPQSRKRRTPRRFLAF